MRSIETQGQDQGVEVRKEPGSRALHLKAKLRDAPEWKIEPYFLRSAGFTKRGKRPRQRDMSFISPPPPPLGTAHLTGKVSPPRQSFSRQTDGRGRPLQDKLPVKDLGAFFYFCAPHLFLGHAERNHEMGPYDIVKCLYFDPRQRNREKSYSFSASFPNSIFLTDPNHSSFSQPPSFHFSAPPTRRRCARHLELDKMHIRDRPCVTSS